MRMRGERPASRADGCSARDAAVRRSQVWWDAARTSCAPRLMRSSATVAPPVLGEASGPVGVEHVGARPGVHPDGEADLAPRVDVRVSGDGGMAGARRGRVLRSPPGGGCVGELGQDRQGGLVGSRKGAVAS